ncbi:MAG: hypothetical protein NTX73_07225 [Rhodobacterales bacterium]|nr:hypothetical protein [Rhodobacterales bacterium]
MFLHLLAWLFRVPVGKRRSTNDPAVGLGITILVLVLKAYRNGRS